MTDDIERIERIERAAIKHAVGLVFSVPQPGRHHTVIAAMSAAGVRYTDPQYESKHEQGFVTSTGRFVGREEALEIARAAGQIVHRCGGDEFQLYSENVW